MGVDAESVEVWGTISKAEGILQASQVVDLMVDHRLGSLGWLGCVGETNRKHKMPLRRRDSNHWVVTCPLYYEHIILKTWQQQAALAWVWLFYVSFTALPLVLDIFPHSRWWLRLLRGGHVWSYSLGSNRMQDGSRRLASRIASAVGRA